MALLNSQFSILNFAYPLNSGRPDSGDNLEMNGGGLVGDL